MTARKDRSGCSLTSPRPGSTRWRANELAWLISERPRDVNVRAGRPRAEFGSPPGHDIVSPAEVGHGGRVIKQNGCTVRPAPRERAGGQECRPPVGKLGRHGAPERRSAADRPQTPGGGQRLFGTLCLRGGTRTAPAMKRCAGSIS